jgi:hypothetical protein
MGIISNLKSAVIRNELIKALDKFNSSLYIPAIDNLCDSIDLDKDDKKAVKTKLITKIREFAYELAKSND